MIQVAYLKQCVKIFHETKSGTLHKRPQLQTCLRGVSASLTFREYVREGDTLVVTRLDRLARSTFHLCQIARGVMLARAIARAEQTFREQLQRKQVNLAVLDKNINTNDATGRLLTRC